MTSNTPARAALTRDDNFRWLMGGALLSNLGDQFTLIALPWLVLQMTGDPLALGLTLAIMSAPPSSCSAALWWTAIPPNRC